MNGKVLSLTEMLMAISEGGAMEDLQAEIRSVALAVQCTRKPGSVTMTLKIAPNGPHAIKVTDLVTSKLPRNDPQETSFFMNEDGTLTRRDPRQPEIPNVVEAGQ